MKTIPFDEEHVKEYLDRCIIHWRNVMKDEFEYEAKYYVDAFQSVRMALFGETLKEKVDE